MKTANSHFSLLTSHYSILTYGGDYAKNMDKSGTLG